MASSSVFTQGTSKKKLLAAAPHPEVKSILQHALDRVLKLLALYDQRIEGLTISLGSENAEPEAQDKADKALLSLTRMVLNLHKDLNRYTALVYPSIPESSKQQGTAALEVNTASELKLVDKQVSADSDDIDVEAMSLEDLKALLEDTREAANQFASAFNLPLMPALESSVQTERVSSSTQQAETKPVGAYSVSGKKLSKQKRKEQKFSHSFFQKTKTAF